MLQQPGDRPQAVHAGRDPRLEFGQDEVLPHQAVGVARPGQCQHVVAEPFPQPSDIVRQGDGRVAHGVGPPQSLSHAPRRPALPTHSDLLPLQPRAGHQRVMGPVLQVGAGLLEIAHQMEDIAATGDLGQRQRLAGAEAGAEVGDDGLGAKPWSANSSSRTPQVSASRCSS